MGRTVVVVNVSGTVSQILGLLLLMWMRVIT